MILKMVISTFIWGSSYVIAKLIISEVPPLSSAFVRFVLTSIFLLLIYLFSTEIKDDLAVLKQHHKYYFVFIMTGFLGVYLNCAAFYYGLQYINAGFASLLIEIGIPICQYLLSILFLKESLSRKKSVAFIFSALGLVIISFNGLQVMTFSSQAVLGLFLILGSVVSFAFYAIICKKAEQISPLGILTFSTVVGTVMFAPSLVVEHSLPALFNASPSFWLNIFYLAFFCSTISFIWWQKGLMELGSTKIAVFGFLVPVWGLILTAVILKEQITLLQIIGSSISILSVWYIIKPEEDLGPRQDYAGPCERSGCPK